MTLPEAAAAPDRSRGGEGAILALGAAVVVASEFVVIGLSPDMARSLDLTSQQAGWFIAWFAIGSALMGPVAVLAAGRMSAGTALVVALLPFAANLLVPLFPSAWAINPLRLLQGAALPLFMSVAGDALSRLWGREDRAIARLYLGVIVGGVLGAPAGVAFAAFAGWPGSFAALGLLAGITALLIHSRPRLRRQRPDGGAAGHLAAALQPRALGHLLLSAIQFAAMFCSYAFLGSIVEARGAGPEASAFWLLLFGLAGLIGNSLAGRWSMGALRAAAVATALLLAVSSLWLAHLPVGDAPLFLLFALWGAVHAASFVVCQLRVVRAAPTARRLMAALNISAANIGIVAGTFLGGQGLSLIGASGPGWAGFAVSILALGVAAVLRYGAPIPAVDRFGSIQGNL